MAPIRVEAAFRPSQAGAAMLAKGGQRCVAAQKMNFKVPPRCEAKGWYRIGDLKDYKALVSCWGWSENLIFFHALCPISLPLVYYLEIVILEVNVWL
jgi:hypothetical protein